VQITEVRIKLMEDAGERLLAFCSITFDDCFVIRDLKIIGGASGPFVAMPSRKLTSHCQDCGCKNHLRATFCNQCGSRITQQEPSGRDEEGRAKLYADIAHPINSQCREMIQERVIQEFFQEQDRAKQPGYKSRYDDFDYDEPPRPHTKPAGRGQTPHQRAGAAGQGRGTGAAADGQMRTPHQRQSRPSSIQGSADGSGKPTSSQPPAEEREPGSDPPGSFGAGIF
jgi:stage V sporulation protein G